MNRSLPVLLAAFLAPAAAAPPGTITDESAVPPYTLPDPLVCADGKPVADAAAWRKVRRPELLRCFENEVYGRTSAGRPEALRFVLREEKKEARGGRATRLRVGVLFEGREDGRQMELLVYLPNKSSSPSPLLFGLNFDGNYTTTDEPDTPGRWKDGPRRLGPEPGAGDWACLGAWAWACSRALDWAATEPRIDARRVAVTGFSRLGKAALWAAAQDERFAMVVSFESGAGGAALSKRIFGETVEHMASRFGHWFCPNYAKYSGNEAALPVDQHELLALVAPRPLLVVSATEDLWSDPKGEFLATRAAAPVYRMLGTDGFAAREWPPPGRLVDSRIGYFLRSGKHDVTCEDWEAMIAFAKKHLARQGG